MLSRIIQSSVAATVFAASAFAGSDPPAWLRQAASAQATAGHDKAPAAVLLDESQVQVNEDGRVRIVRRYAVRILKPEGTSEARGREIYLTDTGKIREMRAWLIRASGRVQQYDKPLDAALPGGDLYNEARLKLIDASRDATAGDVFGYEAASEDRSVFTQFEWQFQDHLPTQLSRFSLTLPKGWSAKDVTFNDESKKVVSTVNGDTHVWEMRNLQFIADEPGRPPLTSLASRLAVSYFPVPSAGAGIGPAFDNWSAVSRWLHELSEPQAAQTDALQAKARSLTAEAKTDWDRIQAICRFVQQNIHYISIQTGVGRGGGYRPHAAGDVLEKGYGDCKDKANLALALLKAAGIQAWLVSIYSRDPTYVREEWPSPQQFNHCILAVKLSGAAPASAIVTHPSLGRLLIFDPTDPDTLVGDLPDHEQNSLALVVSKDAGALLRMPVAPAEAGRLDRQTDIALAANGAIRAGIRERAMGQSASDFRGEVRALSRPDFEKRIETWIANGVTGARISKIATADDGCFTLDVEFSAPLYAAQVRPDFIAFRPIVVDRRFWGVPDNEPRQHPLVLQNRVFSETVRVKLPAGFKPEHLPNPVKLQAHFGSYEAACEVKDGQLIFTRKLLVRATTLPPAECPAAWTFFRRVGEAEGQMIVLTKI